MGLNRGFILLYHLFTPQSSSVLSPLSSIKKKNRNSHLPEPPNP